MVGANAKALFLFDVGVATPRAAAVSPLPETDSFLTQFWRLNSVHVSSVKSVAIDVCKYFTS